MRKYLQHILVFAGILIFFGYIQSVAEKVVCNDVFFHIKYSFLLRKNGLIRELPWLQYTIMKDGWVDHHFLFHVFLIPFTFFSNLIWGAKFAAIFFASIACFSCYFLMVKYQIKYSIFWTACLLVGSWSFLFRMNMTRAQSMGLTFFIISIGLLLRKKYAALGIISFFFMWLYQLSILLIPIVLIAVIIDWIQGNKFDYKILLVTISGLLSGLIINPYFPQNVKFFYLHVFKTALNLERLNAGGEWLPYDSWFLVITSFPPFVLFFTTIFLAFINNQKLSRSTVILFTITILFFLMYTKSKRFIEYWPPFPILFSAFAFNDFLENNSFKEKFDFLKKFIYIPLGIILIVLFIINIKIARSEIDGANYTYRYQKSARWLEQNTSAGDIIYTTDWDDFPELFFFNSKNYYIVGMDPSWMFYYDKKLYKEWDDINLGRACDPDVISKKFKSRFVFTDNKHGGFINNAMTNERFKRVYSDEEASIFEVLPPDVNKNKKASKLSKMPFNIKNLIRRKFGGFL